MSTRLPKIQTSLIQSIVEIQRIVMLDCSAHVTLHVVIVVVLRIMVSRLRKAWIQWDKL